ncbi:hypothetical protein BGZ46_005291, partial [Entomortierella lignicola]
RMRLETKTVFKSDEVSVIKEARTALENMDPKDPQYLVSKLEFKNLIRQSLQRPEKYQEQIDQSELRQPRLKYVLSGNLSTNGYDLRVMGYKLTENKRSKPPTMSPPVPTPNTAFPWSTAPMVQGCPYVSEQFDTQEKVDNLFRNKNVQDGMRCIGIDPGIASTATATLVHSGYKNDNINLSILRGPRDDIDRRYRKQQSRLKIDAEITEIESRLLQRKPVEVGLSNGDLEVTIEGDLEITSNSHDATMPPFIKAIQEYESNLNAQLINVTKDASILQSFYGSSKFKKDKYDFQQALRHDIDKATNAILKMRKHVPDLQPSDKHFEKKFFQLMEDIETSKLVVKNAKGYDWEPYLKLMDERGFLGLSSLPHNERNNFLQSPLVIGLGDGDFRSWRDHGRGGNKFTKNLIRQ